MHKSKLKWLCVDCGRNTKLEHYFVKNEVWFEQAKMTENGMLCVRCLEFRIKRYLSPDDFTSAWINDPRKNSMSIDLRERIEGKDVSYRHLDIFFIIGFPK